MKIHQFNAGYNRLEDRLLLRVGMNDGSEFRFWLTRACLREFFGWVDQWLAPADITPAAARQAFQREAAAAGGDFETPLQVGESFPLGEVPVLVEAIRVESEDQVLRLLMHLADRRTVTLHLNEELMAGIHQVIRQAVQGADWGLAAQATAQTSHLH